jgi:hypothetical protein
VFAPKVEKPQTTAAKGPTSTLAQQRLTRGARPSGGSTVDRERVLQRSVIDQATQLSAARTLSPTGNNSDGDHEREANPQSLTARKAPVAPWTFNNPIFRFPPRPAEWLREPAQFAVPPLTRAMQPKALFKEVHAPRDHEADAYAAESVPAAGSWRPSQMPAIPPDALGHDARWSRLFATDLSAVRLHPESSRAGGRVHALTEGDHVYLAPGRFAPGTEKGDRLIAHELAHVTQQRRSGAPSPQLAAELDADEAAEAAVRGQVARTRASLAPGRGHAYEAWEHRRLGDALGGENRRIRLPNGVEVTYGQIVALSGDFYRSPEALLRAPRSELEAILSTMDRESYLAKAGGIGRPKDADANLINSAYELATTGHDRTGTPIPTLAGDTDVASGPHGEVHEGEHVESGAPEAQASFFDLAAANAAHFSPENIALNWIPKHQLALDLARQAWQSRNPRATPTASAPGIHPSARTGTAPAEAATAAGLAPTAAGATSVVAGRADPAATPTLAGLSSAASAASTPDQYEAQAWLSSAFADHFLTDAFAAGHLISGSSGRTICQDFFSRNDSRITAACWACALADGASPEAAAVIVPAIRAILAGKASSLLLKTVHDYYNRNGLEVRNALGQVWRTVGDARLGGSPETIAMGELASKASRDAVQDVLSTGGTTRAEVALDYIPDTARLVSGTFNPITTFSTDPLVWNPVLAQSLSPSPATNDLYQMIKGNIGPMASLKGKQTARSVESVPGAARRWVGERLEDVKRIPGQLTREIEDLYGAPR